MLYFIDFNLLLMYNCFLINKHSKDIITSSLDLNNVFFQNQSVIRPNAAAHGTGKPLPKLEHNRKLIGYVALGALALLTVVRAGLAAEALWFDQTTGPSNNRGIRKPNNDLFNHSNDTCTTTCELPFFPSCDDLNKPSPNITLSHPSNDLYTVEFYNNVMMAFELTPQKYPIKQNTETSKEVPVKSNPETDSNENDTLKNADSYNDLKKSIFDNATNATNKKNESQSNSSSNVTNSTDLNRLNITFNNNDFVFSSENNKLPEIVLMLFKTQQVVLQVVGNTVSFVGSKFLGGMIEKGFTNTFNLDTLHHGTNILSWISIHARGTMPSFGNAWFGGDLGFGYEIQNEGNTFFCEQEFISRNYAGRSNLNLLKSILPEETAEKLSKIILRIIPTIKLHFPHEIVRDRNLFSVDQTVEDSYFTNRWISPLNMGIPGSIWQSCTYKTPMRMLQNPKRVLTGLKQVGFGTLAIYTMATYGPAFFTSYRIGMIAGLILEMI